MATLKESLNLIDGGVVTIVGAGGKTTLMFAMARELSQAGESVLTTTTTKIFKPDKSQSAHLLVIESPEKLIAATRELLKRARHITAAADVLQTTGTSKLVGYKPEIIEKIKESGLFKWILVEADGAAGRPLKAPDSYEPVIPQSTDKLIGVMGMDGLDKPLTDEWVFRKQRFAELTGLSEGDTISEVDCVTCLLHKNGILQGAPAGAERTVFLNKADDAGRFVKAQEIARRLESLTDTGIHRIIIGQALSDPPVVEYRNLAPKT